MIRGRWIFCRKTQAIVPAAEFYARKYEGITASDLPCPTVMSDVQPYRSVIDGSEIGGRRQHRDHLKAHGCIEVGNEMPKPRARGEPKESEIAAEVQRAMADEGLRSEAMAASRKASRALPISPNAE